MPHRELLTESQRLSLQAPASDERGMVRHYMLSSEDLSSDQSSPRRSPIVLASRSRSAISVSPGRILQQGEQPAAALCAGPTSN